MRTEIVTGALEMAWYRRAPERGGELMFHSDRGSRYASEDFQRMLKRLGMVSSMSRKGNCWDNACAESLFGSLKVERLHGLSGSTRGGRRRMKLWHGPAGITKRGCIQH